MSPPTWVRGEAVLLVLVFATAALLALAVIFGTSAVLLRYRNQARARRFGRLEAVWGPLIASYAADSAPASTVWEKVEDRDRMHFVRVVMRYAERLRGESRDRLELLVSPYLDEFAGSLRRASLEDQALIIRVLATSGLDRYASTVVAALDNRSPLVSMVAARTLARVGGADYAPQILARLDRYKNWSRSFLASLLASMGGDAAPHLRALLADRSAEPWQRTVAADSLRWLNDVAAHQIASRVLEEETDRDLLVQALRLVGRLGNREHGDQVQRLMGSDDFAVRASAVTTAGQMGIASSLPRLEEALVHDESRWVSLHAARALGQLGQLGPLKSLADSPHPRARLARQALLERGIERWIA